MHASLMHCRTSAAHVQLEILKIAEKAGEMAGWLRGTHCGQSTTARAVIDVVSRQMAATGLTSGAGYALQGCGGSDKPPPQWTNCLHGSEWRAAERIHGLSAEIASPSHPYFSANVDSIGASFEKARAVAIALEVLQSGSRSRSRELCAKWHLA
ncbi:hypothetical protein CORC01_03619 [Colletotrichum orchidophilum]|uniref:Uncharacterized protein n=1 Tax=Colletotrichum orchidophilum TaxID=1209926 RepID=A0A1G4BI09_9PEZI|nr:uncharacterized protein CORC01_03619 [Colletotrichum orchidophilum]OHF01052.1 hypothetical protein CORC01_03619 [Colletotrichum orchidophilum]